jgi:hypothetical protein
MEDDKPLAGPKPQQWLGNRISRRPGRGLQTTERIHSGPAERQETEPSSCLEPCLGTWQTLIWEGVEPCG